MKAQFCNSAFPHQYNSYHCVTVELLLVMSKVRRHLGKHMVLIYNLQISNAIYEILNRALQNYWSKLSLNVIMCLFLLASSLSVKWTNSKIVMVLMMIISSAHTLERNKDVGNSHTRHFWSLSIVICFEYCISIHHKHVGSIQGICRKCTLISQFVISF